MTPKLFLLVLIAVFAVEKAKADLICLCLKALSYLEWGGLVEAIENCDPLGVADLTRARG